MDDKAKRVEIFSAGCPTCERTIEQLRAQIDTRHQIVIRDMRGRDGTAEMADALGIRTVPAVVVDGSLVSCCKNTGPTLEELEAVGVARA